MRYHLVNGSELSGTDVWAPWHGVLECGSYATKLSRLDVREDRKIACWLRTQSQFARRR